MVSIGGKIATTGAAGGLKAGAVQTTVRTGAASKIGATKGADAGAGQESNQAMAFQLPGVNSNQSSKAGSNIAGRFAKAEGQGAQNFAGTGIAAGGGSSKPFIPLDSTKMGLEGIAAAFKGLGTAMSEAMKMMAKKEGGEQGQDQAAQQDAMMMAQQNNGMNTTA